MSHKLSAVILTLLVSVTLSSAVWGCGVDCYLQQAAIAAVAKASPTEAPADDAEEADEDLTPQELIDEITSQVVAIRGLEVLRPIDFTILKRAELGPFLEEKLAEGLPSDYLPTYERAMKILGALPQKADLRKSLLSMLSEQIAGLYDDKTKKLYIMEDFDLKKPLARIILAHEICHALQDQHFHLSKLPLQDVQNSDAALAALSVVEGDATVLMQEYAVEHLRAKDLLQLTEALQVDQSAYKAAPYLLRQQLIFPYITGMEFVMMAEALDEDIRTELFRKPPTTTEQVLNPELYLAKQGDTSTSWSLPSLSPSLGTSWTRDLVSNMGQFGIQTMFEGWREWEAAKEAAPGWDGDRYAYYRNGEDHLLVWRTAWDSESDAAEFFRHYPLLLKNRVYRSAMADRIFQKVGDDTLILEGATGGLPAIRIQRQGKVVLALITSQPESLEKIAASVPALLAGEKQRTGRD